MNTIQYKVVSRVLTGTFLGKLQIISIACSLYYQCGIFPGEVQDGGGGGGGKYMYKLRVQNKYRTRTNF